MDEFKSLYEHEQTEPGQNGPVEAPAADLGEKQVPEAAETAPAASVDEIPAGDTAQDSPAPMDITGHVHEAAPRAAEAQSDTLNDAPQAQAAPENAPAYDPNGRYDEQSVYANSDAGANSYGAQGVYGGQPVNNRPEGSAAGQSSYGAQGVYGGQPVNSRPEGSAAGQSSYGAQGVYGGQPVNGRQEGAASGQNGYHDQRASYQQGIYGGVPRGAAGREQAPEEDRTARYDSYRFQDPDGMGDLEGSRFSAKPRKKKWSGGRIAALVAILALLAGSIGAIGYTGYHIFADKAAASAVTEEPDEKAVPTPEVHLGNQDNKTEEGETSRAADEAADGAGVGTVEYSGEELTVVEVVELCMPSMVAITNTSVTEYQNMFGETRSYEDVSAGSGIIVGETDTELLIATNNHVISGAKDITVTFVDETAISGSIKGTDAENDLAIVAVKISDLSADTLKAVRIINIGDSDKCVVGESVVAIGNALGYGQTVTAGIVSALNREVTVDGAKHVLLQTDASINPGNSGGALINMRGELIGINEVKYADTSVEGFGYAIPMATAEPILTELGSKVPREKIVGEDASYIGITCKTVPGYYTQMGYPSGVYVSTVDEGGPAEQAGIVSGDIITAIDGVSIRTTDELIEQLTYYAAGETIKFRIRRMNESQDAFDTMDIMVTLGKRTDSNLFENTEPT